MLNDDSYVPFPPRDFISQPRPGRARGLRGRIRVESPRAANHMTHAEPAPAGSRCASCRRVQAWVDTGGGRERRSAGACCAESCRLCFRRRTVTLLSSVPRDGPWLMLKNTATMGWFLGTQPHTHYLLLVAEQFDISRSDCTRAGGTSVVTCESDNGVLEAGGRGKARDAETGND
jgi:hypothetical protein